VILLQLNETDRLPMPTKANAEFQGTVRTQRTLIEPVQVSPTSVQLFRTSLRTPSFFIIVTMPMATLKLGTFKICYFLLFVSLLLCSVLSFSSFLPCFPSFLSYFVAFCSSLLFLLLFPLVISPFRQRLNQTELGILSP
jgi:hypothetical protein